MATVVNDRDVLLLGTSQRNVNSQDATILITSDSPTFHVSATGTTTPSYITVTAHLLNITGTASFTAAGATITDNGNNTATVAWDGMTDSTAVITASVTANGSTFNASTTLTKVVDGSAGQAGSSAAWVEISTLGGQVFSRATSAAVFAPTSIALNATPYGNNATAYQWQYWGGSSWVNIVGETSATHYVNSGDFTTSRNYRVQATINGSVYLDEITLVQVTGGANSVSGFLTNQSITLAADSEGNVGSFASATGTFKVYDGVTEKTGSAVTYSVVTQTNCTASIASTGVYSITAMTADTASVVLQAVYNGVTIPQTVTLAKSKTGAAGTPANQYASAYLYQWSSSTPVNPTGTSNYNWSTGANTGYVTNDGWSMSVPTNPGTPNLKLYVAIAQIVAASGSTSSTVSYSSASVQAWTQNGATGSTGASGVQAATATVFQWAVSIPAGPSGTSTYTWSGGDIGTVPSGWSTTAGTSPSAGMTLWAAKVYITDSATVAQTSFNWTSASISAVGYAGTNGTNGGTGAQGASYVTAYCASATATTTTTPAQTTGKTSLPATNDGGITGAWSSTVPSLASGQYLYQSDGIYDPTTNKVTWSIPYWSSLKVGSLSSIVENTGTLTVSGTISSANGNFAVDNNGGVTMKSATIQDGNGDVILEAGVALNSQTSQVASGINSAATTATWDGVSGAGKPADNATVGAADAATSLGFNPQFSNWVDTYPSGWVWWNGPAPTKETSAVRTSPYAVHWVVSSNTGMTSSAIPFASPAPAGTFVQGAYDINIVTDNGGSGGPGYLIRLFTNAALTEFDDTIAVVPDKTVTGWQRVPFSARTANASHRIYGIQIYQMAAWSGMPGGLWADGSVCIFDNLTFDFCDASVDNISVSIGADGALSGAGGGQVTLPGMGHNTYRVITSGYSCTATLPAVTGLYINGVLQSGTNITRSYAVIVLNRSTGNIVSATNYDVAGVGATNGKTAADMAAALNALASDQIVLVISYDEPHDHRLDSGLDTAMYRCGASRAVYGSPNFKVRSAYVLVGIPGCGEGNGAEAYQGSVDSDPNAWVDIGFGIVNGILTGVSVSYRPRTLADYSYTGDLNATVGATLGTNVSGQITSSNSSTLVGTGAINSVHISDLRTTNYAEDGSGNPTAGGKLASTGTAFKVASNSMQVGTLVLSDYWFRLVQGVDGSVSSNRIIWRGNNDATTRGGAPDINCLSIIPKMSIVQYYTSDTTQTNVGGLPGSGSGMHTVFYGFTLTPTSYSSNTDNLDAMQQIHVQFFAKPNDTSPFMEIYQSCPSRTYSGTTGADGAVQGSFAASFLFSGNALWYSPTPASANPNLSGTSPNILHGSVGSGGTYGVYCGFLRVRAANTYGWSATKDFGPTTSTTGASTSSTSTTYKNNIACPAGTITGVAGSSGGGSGASGGACPAPWVKVKLLNGKEINASDLHNGAKLAAVNDNNMQHLPQGGTVRDVTTIWAQRYRVKLTNGETTEWSENHRFAVAERGWVTVQNLRGGDKILGLQESVVESVLAVGEGQVVSFRVEGAGTYFAGGLLCHNTKASF